MSMYAACDGTDGNGNECSLASYCYRYHRHIDTPNKDYQTYVMPDCIGENCEHFIKEKHDDR